MQDAEDEVGWSNTRVAYYWNDIDETGEKELTDFEELFSDRIEAISRIICEKLRKARGTERTSLGPRLRLASQARRHRRPPSAG